jgi:CBF1 interacting corepressor
MVAGLKFLSKKGFNPQNFSNRKRVWEREQASQNEERRVKERNEELRRERDDEELTRSRGDSLKVNFLYAVPPGLETSATAAAAAPAAVDNVTLTLRQPGDDDAAAAFRAMLAEQSSNDNGDIHDKDDNGGQDDKAQDNKVLVRGTAPGAFGTVLQGSTYDKFAQIAETADSGAQQKPPPATANPQDVRSSALEKAVGRRQQGGALTLAEQIERFPALANAPRQRGVAVGVTFRPLGTQIRNVRCMTCGIWGHSKGDRECKVSGWNPFEMSTIVAGEADRKTEGHAKLGSVDGASSLDESEDTYDRERRRRKKERKKKDRKKERKKERKQRRHEEDGESGDDKERKKKRKRTAS